MKISGRRRLSIAWLSEGFAVTTYRHDISEAVQWLEERDFRRGCLIENIGQEMIAFDEDFRVKSLNVLNC
jgi:hypothetical protein